MRTAVARGLKTACGYKPTKNDLKRLQPWDNSRHIRELISDLGNRAAEAAESFEMLCAYNLNYEMVMRRRMQLKFLGLLALATSVWLYGWPGLMGGKMVRMIILVWVAIVPVICAGGMLQMY